MRNIYILFTLIMGFNIGLSSQTIQFTYDGDIVNDTIRLDISDGEFRIDFISFKNISSQPRSIFVQLHRLILANNSQMLMCFDGNCIIDTISSTPLALNPNILFTEFDLQYSYENKDLSIGKINILDESSMEVLGSCIVKYSDNTVSLTKPDKVNNVLSMDVYPNPVMNNAIIKYNLPSIYSDAKIIIRNMVGSIVRSYDINNPGIGKQQFSVSDMQNGVYFYSLVSKGKNLSTKKMIVKH